MPDDTKPESIFEGGKPPEAVAAGATKFIPIDQLVASKTNVRKSKVHKQNHEDLVNSIRKCGLLHNLVVAPPVDWKQSDGKYEVLAGNRRLAALAEINEEFVVPCQVVDSVADGTSRQDRLDFLVRKNVSQPIRANQENVV